MATNYGRVYYVSRTYCGGCFDCWGSEGKWFRGNAQGLAVQHHDRTGHRTWVDIGVMIQYGEKKEEGQKELEP